MLELSNEQHTRHAQGTKHNHNKLRSPQLVRTHTNTTGLQYISNPSWAANYHMKKLETQQNSAQPLCVHTHQISNREINHNHTPMLVQAKLSVDHILSTERAAMVHSTQPTAMQPITSL